MTPGRIVAFGEILLRLSPPDGQLLLQTPRLDVWVGGAEANVATGLAALGHPVAMISALPENALGDAALIALRGRGVDTSGVVRTDGRMGLYFATPGASVRAGEVVYDRAGSAFACADASVWDWPQLLAGADRLHLSGITAALGPGGTRSAGHAVAAARAAGVAISFDVNYRPLLWDAWDGQPRETLGALVSEADVLFGNHRDVALLTGRDIPGETTRERRQASEVAFAAYPALQLIAATIRHADAADAHRIAVRIDTRDRGHETTEIALSNIVDRIGGGDAFAAGILHGLRQGLGIEEMARTALALVCLKHALPGDASLFTQRDIDAFLAGAMDVRR